jgi:hypothetical protein
LLPLWLAQARSGLISEEWLDCSFIVPFHYIVSALHLFDCWVLMFFLMFSCCCSFFVVVVVVLNIVLVGALRSVNVRQKLVRFALLLVFSCCCFLVVESITKGKKKTEAVF